MAEHPTRAADAWDATWEGARKQLLESTLAATPSERLACLEEMLELAWRVGALGPRSDVSDDRPA
jgi:hypothetical protein